MNDIKLSTVFQNLSEAISEDSGISAFMAEKYGEGSEVDIYIGIDLENLPESTEKAAVYIIPGSRSRTRGDSYRQHNITIISFVHSTDKNEDDSITTIEALELLDDFTNLVEKCVYNRMREMRLAVTPLSGDSDSVFYPIARSELAYSIEIPSRIF